MYILIIGCGNIGERHLQSVLKINSAKIFVIENNLVKFKELKKKYTSEKLKCFHSIKELYKLNINFNFAIIATNSYGRFNILKNAINLLKIKNIILEKVVFKNKKEYLKILNILHDLKIKIFVNLPIRTINFFKKIRLKKIHNFEMKVDGVNWGLFSNSIHFLDLFFFLTKKIPYFNDENCVKKIFQSKRFGYHEGYGEILFETKCKKNLSLKCIRDKKKIYKLSINLKINKSNYKFYTNNGYDYFDFYKKNKLFTLPFQSNLTHLQIKSIMNKQYNILPNLKENYLLQKQIFDFLKKFKDNLKNKDIKKILIT